MSAGLRFVATFADAHVSQTYVAYAPILQGGYPLDPARGSAPEPPEEAAAHWTA